MNHLRRFKRHSGLTPFLDRLLDGQFNSSDLTLVFQAGHYEDGVPRNSTWLSGDWSGDQEFDSGDLVLAFKSNGYEQGPRAATATVPEPSAGLLFVVGLITRLMLFRTQSRLRFPQS